MLLKIQFFLLIISNILYNFLKIVALNGTFTVKKVVRLRSCTHYSKDCIPLTKKWTFCILCFVSILRGEGISRAKTYFWTTFIKYKFTPCSYRITEKKNIIKVVHYYLGYNNVKNDFFKRWILDTYKWGYLLGLKVGQNLFFVAKLLYKY